MRSARPSALLLCLAALLAAGCGGDRPAAGPSGGGAANPDTATDTANTTPAGNRQAGQASGAETEAAAVAQQTVAGFLGIDAGRVTVVAVTARDFPDASLGCPQPGMAYPQVITPGFQVLVEADGRRFDVRVAGKRGRICHRRQSGDSDRNSGIGDSDPDSPRVPELISRTRADLAARLGLDPADVQVGSVTAWRAGMPLPGCDEPPCPPGRSPCGYLLRLSADERSYVYFASSDALMPCPPIERS